MDASLLFEYAWSLAARQDVVVLPLCVPFITLVLSHALLPRGEPHHLWPARRPFVPWLGTSRSRRPLAVRRNAVRIVCTLFWHSELHSSTPNGDPVPPVRLYLGLALLSLLFVLVKRRHNPSHGLRLPPGP
ncbi:hypothetical protein EJB05_29002, partial [Eragrostis curvula]